MHYEDKKQLLDDLNIRKEEAFSFVFHRYYSRLCLFASQFTDDPGESEDIVDEAFMKIWQGNRSFASFDHFKSSLYQSTRHIALNKRTSNLRRSIRTDHYVSSQEQTQQSQLQQIVYAEAMGELYHAIRSLPPKAQKIISATYLEGKSNEEVAIEMQISIQTVKNQKLRALTLLRARLRRDTFNLLLLGAFIVKNFQ
ncbi:RNA polymerase sigma factor [Sphingobacterium arenae]|uniref:Sigma-70 family RNA polymerase sigma factor n=1 Tax=Sphingobacterium arenae TaxID=1280598 RepID=A0ABR7Y6V5_9SPHI|nr:sigma-70 family RNA polymerase sigma factor [Sphingobacterium arenae]MBD1426988.1 sigma-70 family RNA polymerase sigma factor [Sphingobacterium arenae]